MDVKVFYTYILESCKSGRWYYGHSDNLERRVYEHNTGQTPSTRNKGPWKLIFNRPFGSKLEALRFEMKLKKLKNKDYKRFNSRIILSGRSAAR